MRPVTLLLGPALLAGAAGAASEGIEPGMPLAPFELPTLAGGSADLGELRAGAKQTVVVFWASWSESSLKELATLGELARFQESGLCVIAVNVEGERPTEEQRARVREAAAGFAAGFHVLFDEELSVFRDYGVYAVPTTFLADEAGVVTFRLPGFPVVGGSRMVGSIRGTMAGRLTLSGPWSYRPQPRAVRYHNLGLLLLRKGDVEMGVHTLERAVEIDPEYLRPRALLGDVEKRAGRYAQALAHYAIALEFNADDARVLADSGECLLVLGKPAEGQDRIRRALAQDPGDGLIRALFAFSLSVGEKHAEAEAEFERAVALAPLEYRVRKLRARSHELHGRKAAAIAEYWRAYDLLRPEVRVAQQRAPRGGAGGAPGSDGR